ncbi:MAG: GTP-binding protein [Hyphomicrobiales bacterium]|nr:GTP-binding protein [Hyphomicrobiales bacterium]
MTTEPKPLGAKAPVVILTGFLGSGKTTLLNRILTAEHGRRVAVIVNEFGEVGIDHHLLLTSSQEVVQMNNGCVCCTVRGDLVRSFFQLMEHRDRFDTVVIETSGLAEPAPVAQSIYTDERIRSEFTLAGVVAVVDAKYIAARLEDSAEACEQIAFADLIVLNKTDLSTPEQLDATERQISRLNRVAQIERARNAEIDLSRIFDIGSTIDLSHGREGLRLDCHHDHQHRHHHHHDNHLQHIDTVCIEKVGALDGLKVSLWFRQIIAELGDKILRMKGILNLKGDSDQFLLQGVHWDFEGRPGRAWMDGEERVNRVVFIGRELDAARIGESFDHCLYVEGTRDAATAGDPFGRYIEISPHTLEQIRYWMRQNFGFPLDVPIVIKEVPCVRDKCPPIETSVMAMEKGAPPRVFKIQKPITEITFDHVYNLIENPMPCC